MLSHSLSILTPRRVVHTFPYELDFTSFVSSELVYVIKKLANKENCKYTHEVCSGVYAEAEFLDVIGTKVLRVFLTITSTKDLKLVC